MSKSRPYSIVLVNQVNIETLSDTRRGQACFLGVDVGKFDLVVMLRWSQDSYERPWKVKNPSEVGVLVEKLRTLNHACPVTVAMESSGTYGDSFRQAVHDAGLPLVRVSGKAVKDGAETFDGVPSQHDAKDAGVIADLAARGKCRKWEPAQTSATDQEMRYWVRKLDGLQRIRQVHSGRLEGLLARHWPEVQRLLDGDSMTLLKALQRWGNPRLMGADPQAAEALAKFGGALLSDEKITAVIQSAVTSTGVRMNAWEEQEVKELAVDLIAGHKELARCKRQLTALSESYPRIKAQATAVGLVTACILWSCLGDPGNYGSAAAYRKAMGLNLREDSSGTYKGPLRLSKRGHRLTRKWLYFSTMRHVQDPSVRRWVERKKARDGGKGMRAMVGVMRKLALAAWHVAVHDQAFDAAKLFPGARTKSRKERKLDKALAVPAAPDAPAGT